jgi:hypothetical protein
MPKVINSTYISLDGVIENPQDRPSLGSVDDAGTTVQTDLLMSCDAVLMGRRTYDGSAPVRAGRSGDPYSDRIKAEPGQDIDELRLWVHPFFVGAASERDRRFRAGAPASFDLVDSNPLESGIILLGYRARSSS